MQIFDFINVNFIHNATFANSFPENYLHQARDLANFHEYGIFSSPQPNGIGNSEKDVLGKCTGIKSLTSIFTVAGQTILPSILDGLANIADTKNPLKFVYQAVSYKPFISLFNLTGVAEMNPQLAGFGQLYYLFPVSDSLASA